LASHARSRRFEPCIAQFPPTTGSKRMKSSRRGDKSQVATLHRARLLRAMECASIDNSKPHLFAAVIACGIAALILTGGRTVAIRLEQRNLPSVAPELFPQKHQGLAFQRAAARARDVLSA